MCLCLRSQAYKYNGEILRLLSVYPGILEKYKCVLLFEGIWVRQIHRNKWCTGVLYRWILTDSMAWTGLETTVQKIARSQPFTQTPFPYRLPSDDTMAWARQSLLCWPLQDHSLCGSDQAGAQQEAEEPGWRHGPKVKPDLFHKLWKFGVTIHNSCICSITCSKVLWQLVHTHCPKAQNRGIQFNMLLRWLKKPASYKIACSGTNYACVTALCNKYRSFIVHLLKNLTLGVFFNTI